MVRGRTSSRAPRSERSGTSRISLRAIRATGCGARYRPRPTSSVYGPGQHARDGAGACIRIAFAQSTGLGSTLAMAPERAFVSRLTSAILGAIARTPSNVRRWILFVIVRNKKSRAKILIDRMNTCIQRHSSGCRPLRGTAPSCVVLATTAHDHAACADARRGASPGAAVSGKLPAAECA